MRIKNSRKRGDSIEKADHIPWLREGMKSLVERLVARLRQDGEIVSAIPNLTFYRFNAPTQPTSYLLEPSICLIMQGSKRVVLGERELRYDECSFFVTSIELPLIAQIVNASAEKPYLGMVLRLDRMEIVRLVMESSLPHSKSNSTAQAIELGFITKHLLNAISRMVDLLEEPELIPLLFPLIQREILLRLLLSGTGPKIRQIAVGGSPTHQISKAIGWIKNNLRERLRIENLAAMSSMSVSTLHHHFRALTSFSPLQFQKRLRLNEARWLMVENHLDASSAAFEVGYESPSQFSREYSRMFGSPPLRDVKKLAEPSSQ